MNCALATVDALQGILGLPDDEILAAATGFEGGCGGCGSTCGVITGGALVMAQAIDTRREGTDSPPCEEMIRRAGVYHRWFLDTFGTTLCAERTGVDFHSLRGLFRYFLPGNRMTRCFSHIGTSAAYLTDLIQEYSPDTRLPENTGAGEKSRKIVHCAGTVLERVDAGTSAVPTRIGRIASVFDGGVGLSGGLCGALAGALLAVNVRFGARVRRTSLIQTAVDFVVGHMHLIRSPGASVPDAYAIGKEIVTRFREATGSVVCRDITGKTFHTPEELQAYHMTNEPCRTVFDTSVDLAEDILSRWESR
jgi:C_GCAxxG_C_C family probable redox protein